MRKNRFQVVETYISKFDGSERKAWNVIDTQDNFVVDTFTIKTDANYFASKWSKESN